MALERVLAHLAIDVRRQGRTAVALCPLHDDHRPSLVLHLERGLWYCHACGEGGDGVRLVERVRGTKFADAVREVAAC